MFDLLADPVIRADLRNGSRCELSLPEIYQAMMADDVIGFPALRPHQRHAWHAFLAQLGAIALHEAGRDDPALVADDWRDLLTALTSDLEAQAPWRLIAENPADAAFMQSPAPAGLASYRKEHVAADDLDVLVTSKNHDVKSSIAVDGRVDDWVFALINIQTMGGFGGSGNYGIARMNGGYSSRPCLGLAPAMGGAGAHLAHDIRRLVARRQQIIDGYEGDYFDGVNGLALTWMEPWDGVASLPLNALDPLFIEVCRRIRLVWRDGRIVALTATSKTNRIEAKHARGDVGDHWTPVGFDGKSLSISRIGFRYDRLADLVLDGTKYTPSPAMEVEPTDDRTWRLVARGIASGQGKTEGYHERSDILLRPRVVRALMAVGSRRDRLDELSKDQLAEIQAVTKALRFAVAIAASGGRTASELGASDRQRAHPYLRRLDTTADTHFFRALQDRFEASETDRHRVRLEFVRLLIDRAKSLLDEAVVTVPCTRIQRHRAEARATSAFWGSLRRSDAIGPDTINDLIREEQHVSRD